MEKKDYFNEIRKNDALAKIKKVLMDSKVILVKTEYADKITANYAYFLDKDHIIINIPSYAPNYIYICENYYKTFRDMVGDTDLEEFEAILISALNQCGVYGLDTVRDTVQKTTKYIFDKFDAILVGEISISEINNVICPIKN